MNRSLAMLMALVCFTSAAQAADPYDVPAVPVVTVTTSASANVANDRLQAWLRAEAENPSPAAAASDVNARVAKAIARMKSTPGLTVQTSGYTTQQVSDRGRPARWRVTQTVSVEGSDFSAIAVLATQLQDEDGMLLSGLAFAVSEAKRHETEEALIQQALASWRARAQNAARGLGFSAPWRPGHVTISTNDFSRPQPMMRGGVAAMSAPAAAPVPLEAGATDVTVTVTGDAVLDAGRTVPR